MQKELVVRIAAHYGLKAVSVSDVQKGYRNQSWHFVTANGKDYNLIIYKQEPGILARIHAANRVSEFLKSAGMPVRAPRDPRIMTLQTSRGVRYAALYNYLPGRTIPWEAYTQEHIKLLGQTLSDLHASAKPMPRGELPSVTNEYLAILERMRTYFETPEVTQALAQKLHILIPTKTLTTFEHILRACSNLSGQQPLHMDLVRSNILFNANSGKPEVSGILDFEKTAWGHPQFDIARTLAFLYVDCKYKKPEKVAQYFLRSGYQKRGAMSYCSIPLRFANRGSTLLQELLYLFLLYDMYKFLRHNPYESLVLNEHFVRTQDILVNAGLISVV